LQHFNKIVNKYNVHLAILFQAAVVRTFDLKELKEQDFIDDNRFRYVRYNKKVEQCLTEERLQNTGGRQPIAAVVENSMFAYMDSVSTPGQLRNRRSGSKQVDDPIETDEMEETVVAGQINRLIICIQCL
jgi:hypothetical protein